MLIREARDDDADYAAFARLHPELALPDPVPTRQAWTERFVRGTLFGEREGAIVGYCFFESLIDTGYIRNVISDPTTRRTGVGRALTAAALERFRARGFSRVCLNVKPDNVAAIALYQSFGLTRKYESTAMRIAWPDVERLHGHEVAHSTNEALDVAAERRFGMPRGQLAASRETGRRVLFLLEDGAVVGVAAYDRSFGGAFPFRLATIDHARPLFEAIRDHKRMNDSHCVFVIEDGRAMVDALLAIDAQIRLEILHFEGAI